MDGVLALEMGPHEDRGWPHLLQVHCRDAPILKVSLVPQHLGEPLWCHVIQIGKHISHSAPPRSWRGYRSSTDIRYPYTIPSLSVPLRRRPHKHTPAQHVGFSISPQEIRTLTLPSWIVSQRPCA